MKITKQSDNSTDTSYSTKHQQNCPTFLGPPQFPNFSGQCKPQQHTPNHVVIKKSYLFYTQFGDSVTAEHALAITFCHAILYTSAATAIVQCMSCSCILSKRINVSSNFFRHREAAPFWFLHTKCYGNIPTGTPKGTKITICDQYLAFVSITSGLLRVVNISRVEYRLQHVRIVHLPHHASLNLVYDRTAQHYAYDNDGAFNCTH